MKKIVLASLLAACIATPAFADDLASMIKSDPAYKSFSEVLTAAGMEDTLKGDGPFTLFIPTNDAFAKFPKDKMDKLMANKEELVKFVQLHIIAGKLGKADVEAGKIKTMEGDELSLSVTDGIHLNNINVRSYEDKADNGTIHVIEEVITLGGSKDTAPAKATKHKKHA